MKASGLSLWLVPQGDFYAKLAAVIEALGRQHGTPVFEPHITLLGGLEGARSEVLARSEELARRLGPVVVRLTSAAARDEYFRSLFVWAEPTPSLMDAHARANEAFGRRDERPFEPHLSLMYGHLTPQRKQAVLAEIDRDFSATFETRVLHLVSTQGEPEAWRLLGRFPFGGCPTSPA